MIHDRYGRPVFRLRISVTERCNLKCIYCHREGITAHSPKEMTPEEIARITKITVKHGVSKIKLTGGEPLEREDITEIVRQLSRIDGIDDLAMTTNGILLTKKAKLLKQAGLQRVNINFPSLNPSKYNEIAGGNLNDLLNGLNASIEAGFNPIKLNMVVLRGLNDEEVKDMISFSRQMGVILQLIELENINLENSFYIKHYQELTDIETQLKKESINITTRRTMQNRKVYSLPGVDVEIVSPLENTEFCSGCTRLRITSDGKFKPCLMRDDNLIDFLTPMRNGAGDDELERLFLKAVDLREPYYKKVKAHE